MFKITLKAARINANMRQTDAAMEVGVSRDTIRNWETGRSSPKADQLCKLADLYGVPMDYIFFPTRFAKSDRL